MVDACRIRRKSGTSTRVGAHEIPDYLPDIYEGKCRFQQGTIQGFRTGHPTVGGRVTSITVREVSLPIDAPQTDIDDEIIPTVTRDPILLDRVFRVVGDTGKTHATAHRLEVEEVTA